MSSLCVSYFICLSGNGRKIQVSARIYNAYSEILFLIKFYPAEGFDEINYDLNDNVFPGKNIPIKVRSGIFFF